MTRKLQVQIPASALIIKIIIVIIYFYKVTAQDVTLYKSQIHINVLKLFSGLVKASMVNMKITKKLNWPYLWYRILHENTAF